ncbi:MAG: hypothetical protein KF782_34775 [Labilithrix sp.]|nr:hypothetical protein [Labilithrix sp.]
MGTNSTMHDRDAVIRHAIAAADAHATAVSRAITALIFAADAEALAFAERQLRSALVAQAAGHEPVAANGSTYAGRRAAAAAALEAWDGKAAA